MATTSSQAVHLSWRDVCYDVVSDHHKANGGGQASSSTKDLHAATATATDGVRHILTNVCGQVGRGEVMAIIGPSGSGKTSLLNILAQRRSTGVTGTVELNGTAVPKNFKAFSAYVTQDDAFFETLTVYETLGYAAELRLPQAVSHLEREERIERVIDEVDLQKCRDTVIGRVGEGISGGERRRLSIAMEIISQPSLLILDEPTTGLDSAASLSVAKLLRSMRDRTVICTIHQPRASILRMFDRLMVLGEGRMVYFGPPPPLCLDFFRLAGYQPPPYENVGDWILDLINTKIEIDDVSMSRIDHRHRHDDDGDNNGDGDGGGGVKRPNSSVELARLGIDEADTAVTATAAAGGGDDDDDADEKEVVPSVSREHMVKALAVKFAQSPYFAESMRRKVPLPPPIVTTDMPPYPTGWLHQTWSLLRRSFKHKLREPIAVMTQATNATIIPLVVGTIYWNLPQTALGADDRLGAISFIVLLQSFMCYDILLLFPLERRTFNRERDHGLYPTSAFYFGRTLAEMPFHILFAVVLSTITYWTIGLQNDAAKFAMWTVIVTVATITGASILLFCGAVSKSLDQSNLIGTFLIIIMVLFDGNWVALENVPVVYRWIHYVSLNSYAVESAIANEMRGMVFECDVDDAFSPIKCPFTGEDYLEFRGYGDVSITTNLMCLLAMVFGYRVLAYYALRYLHTGRPWSEMRNL